MATALSLFVILALSSITVRVGAAALWLTGLPDYVARFQALSAFTTTGFTTAQASLVVSHPERRRIISVLMLLGNAGIITVVATIILSYVEFEPTAESLFIEIFWLLGAAVLLWIFVMNKWVDRHTTLLIHRLLRGRTRLAGEDVENLLLLPNGYQVAAITVGVANKTVEELLATLPAGGRRTIVLGVLRSDDTYISAPLATIEAQPQDKVLLYGSTRDLEVQKTSERR
jgi:hypothetical protein